LGELLGKLLERFCFWRNVGRFVRIVVGRVFWRVVRIVVGRVVERVVGELLDDLL